ncbi:MAG: hypothetical protein D6815_12980 [Candidatus Dadabacteria bacterium]|nr:MAG: hypothetical protein D6815_12980 [Candidatus Dadabacteria bacterium]
MIPKTDEQQSRSGRPAAVVHLDLDGASHIFRAHGRLYGGEADAVFDSGLTRALAFFERHGIRATLFTIAEDLGDRLKRARLMEAVKCGHEIASHSLTHGDLRRMTAEEQELEIRESRMRLSQSLGTEVIGFRAPGFGWVDDLPQKLAAAGYRYDSSRFWSPNRDSAAVAGVGRGQSRFARTLGSIIELPLPAYRPLPLPFHPSYAAVLGLAYFRIGLARWRRLGMPLVLLFHLVDFSDPLPAALAPGVRNRLFTLSFLSTERKEVLCHRILALVRERYRMISTIELLGEVRSRPLGERSYADP